MSTRNLLINPCWRAKDLGQPLPDSPHAVSVALPRWEDVIAYEEKEPSLLNSLRAIYPRFGLNPLVFEVAQCARQQVDWDECSAWPYPNKNTAKRANLDLVFYEIIGDLQLDERCDRHQHGFGSHFGGV